MTNYQISQLEKDNSMAYYVEVVGGNKLEYFCYPKSPELLITDLGWKIMRMETVAATEEPIAGKSIQRAGGSPDFAFRATDLAYVKALTYL